MRLFKSEKLIPRSGAEYKVAAWAILGFVLLLIADQAGKFWVEKHFYYGESIPVIKHFFSLTYVTNKGAAWSILSGHGKILLIFGLAVMAASIVFVRKLTDGYRERYWALMLILAGVAGNSFDRLWRGEVVDFLDFVFGSYHYPIFNLADCYICVGVGLFILSGFLRPSAASGK